MGLLELAGNQRMSEIIGGLRDQTRLVGLRSLAAADALQASAAEHRPILEAAKNVVKAGLVLYLGGMGSRKTNSM